MSNPDAFGDPDALALEILELYRQQIRVEYQPRAPDRAVVLRVDEEGLVDVCWLEATRLRTMLQALEAHDSSNLWTLLERLKASAEDGVIWCAVMVGDGPATLLAMPVPSHGDLVRESAQLIIADLRGLLDPPGRADLPPEAPAGTGTAVRSASCPTCAEWMRALAAAGIPLAGRCGGFVEPSKEAVPETCATCIAELEHVDALLIRELGASIDEVRAASAPDRVLARLREGMPGTYELLVSGGAEIEH